MHINSLPSDCLLLFLNHFSIQEQIPLRLVCQHWKATIESFLARKKSLKLFGSLKNVRSYISDCIANGLQDDTDHRLKPSGADDDLIINVAYFDTEFCHLLFRLFPNIEKFLLCYGIVYPFHHVPYLLQHWQQLTTLSLCGRIYPADEGTVKNICRSIATNCPNLKCLHLLAGYFFESINSIHDLQLDSTLSRLSHLSLNAFPGDLVQILEQLESECQHLYLNYIDFSSDQVNWLTSSSLSLKPLISTLQISGLHVHHTTVFANFLAVNFSELNCLKINFCRYPMMKFTVSHLQQFQQLNHMTELHLSVNFDLPDGTPLEYLPTLSQIITLHLTLLNSFDSQLKAEHFCHALAIIFPQVEQMSICHGDESFLCQLAEHMLVFSTLMRCRLYSSEDEGKYLARHLGAVREEEEQESNRLYSQRRIRQLPLQPRRKVNDHFEFWWQKEETK